jgi:hypothetical protein
MVWHDRPASYDLAVWVGIRPSDDRAAGNMFESLFDRYLESGDIAQPADRIRAYVAALVQRYPDTGNSSPWSCTPVDEGAGPIVYLTMAWSRCEEVSAWAAQLAAQHDLVCYDPQMGRLRP